MISNILSEFKLTLPEGDKGDVGTQFKVMRENYLKTKLNNLIILQAGTAVLRNPKPYRIVINSRE